MPKKNRCREQEDFVRERGIPNETGEGSERKMPEEINWDTISFRGRI